jgi:uncharacterized protein related to proFAR isomerase
MLEGALERFAAMEAGSFALETEVRIAELEALRGERPRDLLDQIDSLLERTDEAAAMAPLQSNVHRIRAAALAQLGDETAARSELEESARIAEDADAVHELALALDLAGALGDAAAAKRSATLVERLGIERVARPSLGSPQV